MSAAEDIWDHWAENYCDGCDKRIHANAGALCVRCALDFHLADDPFASDVQGESIDDVFAVTPNRRVRPEPLTVTELNAAADSLKKGRP